MIIYYRHSKDKYILFHSFRKYLLDFIINNSVMKGDADC
jgi:hypothetical protein